MTEHCLWAIRKLEMILKALDKMLYDSSSMRDRFQKFVSRDAESHLCALAGAFFFFRSALEGTVKESEEEEGDEMEDWRVGRLLEIISGSFLGRVPTPTHRS